ncbi:MAG: CRTAC1 family protein [Planctomycetota bacterium]
MRNLLVVVILISGSILLMAQKVDEAAGTAFEDVTKTAGVEVQKGQARHVAWGDFDNDGWEDLLLNGSILFQNSKGKFVNVTQKAKLTKSDGGIWGDYDNDGYLDILAYSLHDYTLWRNNKNGTFIDVTKEAGLGANPHPTQAVAWIDVNNDGYLDFYATNYERQDLKDEKGNQIIAQGTPDVLYLNNKNGTFTDITEKAGVNENEKPRCGYGIAPADFNNDGLMDLYVTNYRLGPNYLYQNNGDGTFTDVAREKGVLGKETEVQQENGIAFSYGHSIGAVWGDIDNDGDLDLFCANLAHPGRFLEFSDTAKLYVNQGAPECLFSDIRKQAGIPYQETHSEPSFGDYDKDGFIDMYLSCVYEKRKALFYRNQGDLTFKDITEESGIDQEDGWSSAWGDFDNDGNLDLAVGGSWSSTLKLYRNKGNKLPYLKVRAESKHCSRFGIGARIKVASGKLSQIREISGSRGLASQDSLIAFFGLGSHKGTVDVEVRFPCGKTRTLKAQSVNKMITVTE